MKDFSKLNELPSEVKVLLVNSQNLVDEAKEALQGRKYDFDLTSKRELRSDIKNVERYLTLIKKGKVTEKNVKRLENASVYLHTVLNGLINFFTRGEVL